jgi:hypothetical protein
MIILVIYNAPSGYYIMEKETGDFLNYAPVFFFFND